MRLASSDLERGRAAIALVMEHMETSMAHLATGYREWDWQRIAKADANATRCRLALDKAVTLYLRSLGAS